MNENEIDSNAASNECLRHEQRLLQFDLDPVFTFANFVPSPENDLAVEAIHHFYNAQYTSLTLVGESGTGKTHLLQATVADWRQQHGQESALYLDVLTESYPGRKNKRPSPTNEGWLSQFLAKTEGRQLVAVDHMDRIQELSHLQEALLYLFNGLRRTGGKMLCASQNSLSIMGKQLRRDLSSRLLWGTELLISPPNDTLLLAILRKMTNDRQVRVHPDLLKFLVYRLPRRVHAYAMAIDAMDNAAMRNQRPLTIPLAKEVLGL